MHRFYTPADSRKSFRRLYSVDSIQDYIRSIASLKIDIKKLKETVLVHEDYAFSGQYICDQIEAAQRVVLLGVYDLSKEGYFMNKYPQKEFVVGDVSIAAIKDLPDEYENVTVVEATSDNFLAESNDLIIVNFAECFLSQKQMNKFLSSGGGVIINNAHLYMPSIHNRIHWIAREIRAAIINIISIITRQRQWQFRGWWRTVGDFMDAAESSDKYVKTVMFNSCRNLGAPGLYAAMIHFEQK